MGVTGVGYLGVEDRAGYASRMLPHMAEGVDESGRGSDGHKGSEGGRALQSEEAANTSDRGRFSHDDSDTTGHDGLKGQGS